MRPSTALVRSAAAAVQRSARLRADGSGPGRGGYRYSQYGRGTVKYGTGPRMRAGRLPGRDGTGSRGRRRACAPPPRLRGTTARTHAHPHTHTHTHTHTHSRTRTLTHTRTHARTRARARTWGGAGRGGTGRAAREVELAVQIRALLRVPSMDSLRNGFCGGTAGEVMRPRGYCGAPRPGRALTGTVRCSRGTAGVLGVL